MYSLKDARLYHAAKLCHVRHRKDIQVFRTNHHIHRCLFTETFVHTLEIPVAEMHQLVFHHHPVQDIAFANEIGYKRIDGFIVNIGRSTNLLDTSLAHHHDGIAQGQSFFLVVSDIHKSDAQ